MGNMGSAHLLVEVNVSFKFEGNPSISKGVLERTRIGDGRIDRPTGHILWWGYNKYWLISVSIVYQVSVSSQPYCQHHNVPHIPILGWRNLKNVYLSTDNWL